MCLRSKLRSRKSSFQPSSPHGPGPAGAAQTIDICGSPALLSMGEALHAALSPKLGTAKLFGLAAKMHGTHRFPRLCCFAPLALVLLAQACSQVYGEQLRQYPFFDVDGWSCHGRGCQELRMMHGALVGHDGDDTTWYFSAPAHVLSELPCASAISFRITHPEFDSKGKDAMADFDVVVVSKALGRSLGLRSIVPPWAISTNVAVSLDGMPVGGEAGTAVWVDTDDSSSQPTIELHNVLQHVSALLIRGSFYAGAEVTCIESFMLTLHESCSRRAEDMGVRKRQGFVSRSDGSCAKRSR